jgi:hypothetical protein
VSRRRRPGRAGARPGAKPGGPGARPEPGAAARGRADGRPGRGLAGDVAILAAVFLAAVGVAELAGAANLGVAIGVGQVAFAIALALVLVRR